MDEREIPPAVDDDWLWMVIIQIKNTLFSIIKSSNVINSFKTMIHTVRTANRTHAAHTHSKPTHPHHTYSFVTTCIIKTTTGASFPTPLRGDTSLSNHCLHIPRRWFLSKQRTAQRPDVG